MPTSRKVTKPGDGAGTGTLRSEIAAAQNGDTITFDKALTTITLTKRPLTISKNITINGLGKNKLTIKTAEERAFEIAPGTTVVISKLTLTGRGISNKGNLTINDCHLTNSQTNSGGGLENHFDATATLNRCDVFNNKAVDGGGIASSGTVLLKDCSVYANKASRDGGGIFCNVSSGPLTLEGCSVHENKAHRGGGIGCRASLTITQSTVANNTALIDPDISPCAP